MPAGRPSKYLPAYAAQLIEFFDVEAFEERVVAKDTGSEKVQLVAKKFPTLTRFAATISVHPETLLNWAHEKDAEGKLKHPEFFDAYTRAKAMQESLLVEGAMMGTYNPQFSQFAAINIFGWKSRHELTGPENRDLIPAKRFGDPGYLDDFNMARRALFAMEKALRIVEEAESNVAPRSAEWTEQRKG